MHHLVPKAGLEPARISTVDFESTASTDFATSALKRYAENVVDYTCRRRSCKRQRVVIALSVEKNSAILRGVTFYDRSTARLPPAPLLSLPREPGSPCQPPFSPSNPKPHSNLSQLVLTSLSTTSPAQPIFPQINSPRLYPNIPPNPTHHHSHIFQKVLANAFLLFIRPAVKY